MTEQANRKKQKLTDSPKNRSEPDPPLDKCCDSMKYSNETEAGSYPGQWGTGRKRDERQITILTKTQIQIQLPEDECMCLAVSA